jgi:hypothetical protein
MTIVKTLGLALASILVVTTVAQAAMVNNPTQPKGPNEPNTRLLKQATCTVIGNTDFPDDVTFTNKGNVVLTKGTKIHFKVSSANTDKTYVLEADLAPGANIGVEGILTHATQPYSTCKIVAIA